MKIYNFYLITIISLLFIGCSSTNSSIDTKPKKEYNREYNDPIDVNYKRYYKKYNGYSFDTKSEPMINYRLLAMDAVKQLFRNQEIPDKIIVTDFVEISSLKNHSKIGYILSNSIKDSLINIYNANVVEAEVSNYFKLSANGLRLLTRDTKKVKSLNYKIDNAVVGTYAQNGKELVVFVKLINLETGIIKGSYTNSMLLGDDIVVPSSEK